ncbi:hypothetical protein QVD17_39603 [Tagetes erecta]|uniref:Transmembrane protein n=1 Tax=Tagetes erecta TaxID=13708 RepID=A0AAD8JNU9_TARER|nr:hypothetical protein QVD17_39603 [Tagetes erecta]
MIRSPCTPGDSGFVGCEYGGYLWYLEVVMVFAVVLVGGGLWRLVMVFAGTMELVGVVEFVCSNGEERHHWVSWETICCPKEEGCVRIRSLHQVMQALHIGVEFYTIKGTLFYFFGLCSCEANRSKSKALFCSVYRSYVLPQQSPHGPPHSTLFHNHRLQLQDLN